MVEATTPRQGFWSPGPPFRVSNKERGGSPKFPSYPCACMPRSETPVVSCVLALPHPGLLPSGPWKPSTFPSVPSLRVILSSTTNPFRGSMTRPASLLHPASYAHCWVCTWMGLLTCWLGFGQVRLAPSPVLTHWVTTTNFMGLLPIPRSRAYLGATSAGFGWGGTPSTALQNP